MNQFGTPNQNGENKGSNLIGTGEGESPLAKVPFQKIDMRTMESDMSSIKASGGGNPTPYAPTNTAPAPRSTQSTPFPATGAPTFNVADMSAPDNSGISGISGTPPSGGMPPVGPKNNKMFLWIIIGIVVLGLIAAAYFFLLPGLKGVGEVKNEILPTEQTSPAEEVAPVEEITSTETPETIAVHASYFKTPADVVSEIQPQLFSSEGVKILIQPTSTTVPLLKELVIKTSSNQPISFGSFTGLFFPTFFTPNITLNFEQDFTFVSYANKSGTWLAFVTKLKDSSDMSFVQSELNRFQNDPGIIGFYLSNPGSALSWKDGKIAGKPASVMEFSTRGVEFAYVWVDRYLIVTTNLDAAAAIMKRLSY